MICAVCKEEASNNTVSLSNVPIQMEGECHRSCWSDLLYDNEVRHHRLKVKKLHHSGSPTQYPTSDKVVAKITVNIPDLGGHITRSFVFIREKTVASSKNDNLDPFHDVLLHYGIEIDLDSHPIWDRNVNNFNDAGFPRGVLHDSLDETSKDEYLGNYKGENQ